MNLDFKTKFISLFKHNVKLIVASIFACLSMLLLNSFSMPMCTFGYANMCEISANLIRLAEKNDNGYVDLTFSSKNGNYFNSNSYGLYKLAEYQENNHVFITYDDYNFSYWMNENNITYDISSIGLIYNSNRSYPFFSKELAGDYYDNYAAFEPNKPGAIISYSLAEHILETYGYGSIDELISLSISEKTTNAALKIIAVVDDDNFLTQQLSLPGNNFIITNYTNFKFEGRDTYSKLHVFMNSDYYLNYSLFYRLYEGGIYLPRSMWYMDFSVVNNEWISQEINNYISNTNIFNASWIPFVFSALAVIIGFFLILFLKKNKVILSSKSIFYTFFFVTFCYLLLSHLLAKVSNGAKMFGFHVISTSAFAYLFLLIYIILFWVAFFGFKALLIKPVQQCIVSESNFYEIKI